MARAREVPGVVIPGATFPQERPAPLSVKQAAARLGVSPSLVYALIACGRLRHYRIGIGRGTIRVEEGALEEVKMVTAARVDDCLAAGLKHLRLR